MIPALISLTTLPGLISNSSPIFVAMIKQRFWRTKHILPQLIEPARHLALPPTAACTLVGSWDRLNQKSTKTIQTTAKPWELGSKDTGGEVLFDKASNGNHLQESWFDEGKSHKL